MHAGFFCAYIRVWLRKQRYRFLHALAQYNLRRAHKWKEKIFVIGLGVLLILFFVLPMLALPLRSVSRLEAARGERTDVQYGLTGRLLQ